MSRRYIAPRCAHRFDDGRQCRNRARPKSDICGTHKRKSP